MKFQVGDHIKTRCQGSIGQPGSGESSGLDGCSHHAVITEDYGGGWYQVTERNGPETLKGVTKSAPQKLPTSKWQLVQRSQNITETLKRANQEIARSSWTNPSSYYNPAFQNCEHTANKICTGTAKSEQVETVAKSIKTGISRRVRTAAAASALGVSAVCPGPAGPAVQAMAMDHLIRQAMPAGDQPIQRNEGGKPLRPHVVQVPQAPKHHSAGKGSASGASGSGEPAQCSQYCAQCSQCFWRPKQ